MKIKILYLCSTLQILLLSLITPTVYAATAPTKTEQIISYLTTYSLPLTCIIFFALGLLLAFTPCVLPLLPVTVNIIVGAETKNSTYQAIMLVSVYVFSMAICYTIAGIVAAYLGATIQIFFQEPWFILSICALLTIFAILQLEIISPVIYHRLSAKLHFTKQVKNSGSVLSAIIMGAASALALTPCATPALIGILTYISQTGKPWLGGAALFCMSLGMGTPLIVVALIGKHILPKAGMWLHTVKHLTGFLLLGLVIWLLGRILTANIVSLLWSSLMLIAAIYLGAFNFKKTDYFRHRLQKSMGVCLFLGAIFFIADSMKFLTPLVYTEIPDNNTTCANTNIIAIQEVNPVVIPTKVGNQKLDSRLCGNDKARMSNTNTATKPTSSTQTTHIIPPQSFQKISNIEELTLALAQAKLEKKPTILYFHANWCSYCRKLGTTFHTLIANKGQAQNFVLLDVDLSHDTADTEDLVAQYQVFGLPAVLFFAADGMELGSARISEALGIEDLRKHLERVLSE